MPRGLRYHQLEHRGQSDSKIVYGTAAQNRRRGMEISTGGNGHYYLYVREHMTWLDAKRRAEKLGGYLATITSAAEKLHRFISDQLLL